MKVVIDAATVAVTTACLQDVVDAEDIGSLSVEGSGCIIDELALARLHALHAEHEVVVYVPQPREQRDLADWLRAQGFTVVWAAWDTLRRQSDVAVTARRHRGFYAEHVPALGLAEFTV